MLQFVEHLCKQKLIEDVWPCRGVDCIHIHQISNIRNIYKKIYSDSSNITPHNARIQKKLVN